jgi:hypothetical protein
VRRREVAPNRAPDLCRAESAQLCFAAQRQAAGEAASMSSRFFLEESASTCRVRRITSARAVMATVSVRAASLGSVGHVGATSWTRLPRQLRGNQASVRRSGVGPVTTRISSTTTNACHRCVANGVLFAAPGPRPRRATDHRCATAKVHNKASPKGDASTRADRTEEEGAMTTNTSEKKNQIEKRPEPPSP